MKNLNSIIGLFVLSVFISCNDEDGMHDLSVSRTLIVYMAADNDLSMDALADIEEMKQGFSETGVHLVVFVDVPDEAPYLLEIGKNKSERIKTYDELNSADVETLHKVINEIIALYPAEKYGLILWSHGTSWMPAGTTLRSFGKDSGREMNIVDLAESLPVKFDFILFDACLMGSVEVAYELKDKTDYILASSTETIYEGFPYDEIIPELSKPQVDLPQAAQRYFDYYNSLQGAYRSATVSVIDTRELSRLAGEMNKIVSENEPDVSFERTSVQRLDVYDEQYTFDLADFIEKAFPDADKSAFIAQLNRAVLHKNATPEFLSGYEINAYCGLSCYIPHPLRPDLNEYYGTLSWYIDGGINNLFNKTSAGVIKAAIQEEMRQLIERGNSNPATQDGTHVEPLTTQSGQDTVSEQTTPETLLPP
ncbi:MAG: hypothetical protein LBC19_05025 [Tannerella sp.]|jgi:hypothetical protein|nr:hypothetical protein [Tannerella sp.]